MKQRKENGPAQEEEEMSIMHASIYRNLKQDNDVYFLQFSLQVPVVHQRYRMYHLGLVVNTLAILEAVGCSQGKSA